MSNGIVYKIINHINNMIYIGSTTQTLQLRFRQHKAAAKSGNSTKICQAIRKYGAYNFTIELLEDVIRGDIVFREQIYIDKYTH